MKEIIKSINLFTIKDLERLFLAGRKLIDCEREHAKESPKTPSKDNFICVFIEFLNQAITWHPKLLMLHGNKIFKIYRIDGSKKEDNIKKAMFLELCLLQTNYIMPSKNFFFALKFSLIEHEYIDSTSILSSLTTLQKTNDKGSLIWLSEVLIPILFYQQQFPPPVSDAGQYDGTSKKHFNKLENLLYYIKETLNHSNYNASVIEHIAVVLCYSVGIPTVLCKDTFRSIMNSDYKIHCLYFLIDLLEGKCSVEIAIKQKKVMKGKPPTYSSIHKLMSDSIPTVTKELLNVLLPSRITPISAGDSKAEKCLLDFSSIVEANRKRILVGVIDYLKVKFSEIALDLY